MAFGLSHNLLCFQSSLRHKHNNQIQRNNHDCFCYSSTPPNPYSSRLRWVPKSSSPKNPSSVAADPESLPSPQDFNNDLPVVFRNQNPDPDPDSAPSISNSLSFTALLHCFREVLKLDRLGLEILSIALPAALALAADPITSLVDTAFVGHLGSIELAAVGVSVSVFNLVSKLFNVPLLNVTTSFVAEEQALVTTNADKSDQTIGDRKVDQQGKILLPSVSTSLALAAGLGIAEAIALSVGSGFLMNSMGIPVDSPMRMPAEQFLNMRAFGAPPIVMALAAQGNFRGFKDTKTPFFWQLAECNIESTLNILWSWHWRGSNLHCDI